jgi:hypothetical protein
LLVTTVRGIVGCRCLRGRPEVSGYARRVAGKPRDRSVAVRKAAGTDPPRPVEREELLLHLQRTAGNAAVARTLQRMFHNKAWQAATERKRSDDDEPQDWGGDNGGPEEEEKEPTLLDLFEEKMIAYRSINEKEEYDNTDPRVDGLLKFWAGPLGKALNVTASTVTDNGGRTIDEIIARIHVAGYSCHHNATQSLEEIIAKLREIEKLRETR